MLIRPLLCALFYVITAFGIASPAYAQTSPESRREAAQAQAEQAQKSAAEKMDERQTQALDSITQVISTLQSEVQSRIGLFTGYGNSLISALLLIAISWIGVKGLLQGANFSEIVGDFVMLTFVTGIATWAVNSDTLMKGIESGFSTIATDVISSTGIVSGGDGVYEATSAFIQTVLHVYDMPTDLSWWPKSWVPAAGMVLTKIFMAVFLLAATLAYLAMYIMTQIMFGIGMILAPLLIPFYIIQPMSFLATGWFKFMLSAGFAKVTGALILALTIGLLQSVGTLIKGFKPEEGVPFGLYSMTFLVVGIMAVMMMQAWSIGTSILTGISRVGSGLPSKLQPGGMATAASGTMQRAGRTAAQGVGAGAGAIVGGAAGAVSNARANRASSSNASQGSQGASSSSRSGENVTGSAAASAVDSGPTGSGNAPMKSSMGKDVLAGAMKGAQIGAHPIKALLNAANSSANAGTKAASPSMKHATPSGSGKPLGTMPGYRPNTKAVAMSFKQPRHLASGVKPKAIMPPSQTSHKA